MNSSDILRRVRYTLNLDDATMIAIFKHADVTVTRSEVSNWLKREDDPDYKACSEKMLLGFLDGLITQRRGPKDGQKRRPDGELTNNMVLQKLRIALKLNSEEVLRILALTGFGLSAHELSAFFRKPGHKHYRRCLDQVLRNFLSGLQIEFRGH
jgi:uncharacterized protein YehS (DUF1456 family)